MKQISAIIQSLLDGLKKILTWNFWFFIGKLPENDEGISIPGDPEAVPRSDPSWREQWKWVVLVPEHPIPFSIHFESPAEGLCKKYSRVIETPYVALRIGPDTVRFVAAYEFGHGVDTMSLDVVIGPDRESCIKEELAKRFALHKVTWI
jgi:hypothetical protein